MERATDTEIMERVRDGEVALLSELFERYHASLYRYFVHVSGDRTLSEDLVQDVFFRVLKFRQTFQHRYSFQAWIYQIARNAHVDCLRKKRSEICMPESQEGEVIDFPSPELGPDESYRKRQEIVLLQRALSSMPAEKRELLVLSRFQGLRYEEIAAIAQCEVATIKVRIHRALKDLSSRFQALAGEQAS